MYSCLLEGAYNPDMGLEGKVSHTEGSYRDQVIGEVQTYITIYSGENKFENYAELFSGHAEVLKSYQKELEALEALPEDTGEAEVRALHNSFEQLRAGMHK